MSEDHLSFYRRWNRLAKPYFSWQFEQFSSYLGQRVADIGCGPGNLVPQLMDRELYLGVDGDQDMLREIEAAYGNEKSVMVIHQDVTLPELTTKLKEYDIDSVLCMNLIAHLEDDVGALKIMVDALPVGGALALLVPAMPGLFGSLDELDNFHRRYTKASLLGKLGRLPLRVEKISHFNTIGALGWWWKSRILRSVEHDDNNYTIMNSLIPILRPIEKFMSPPFGLSLIVVAHKI